MMWVNTCCWGGRFDQLRLLLLKRRITENTVANPLAAWLTYDQLANWKILGRGEAPSVSFLDAYISVADLWVCCYQKNASLLYLASLTLGVFMTL